MIKADRSNVYFFESCQKCVCIGSLEALRKSSGAMGLLQRVGRGWSVLAAADIPCPYSTPPNSSGGAWRAPL
jgi:hypothetical protein